MRQLNRSWEFGVGGGVDDSERSGSNRILIVKNRKWNKYLATLIAT